MAIKGGDLIHVGNQILIDRAQTAGPGQVNIATEKIYELGNYYSVGQVRDIPDMSFALESLDASAELEAALLGLDFATMADGTALNPAKSLPMDIASEFKGGFNSNSPYNVVGSVALPYLTMESLSYKFGISDKATQSVSLKGDSVFYNPGSAYIEEFTGTNAANQEVAFSKVANPYKGDLVAGTRYALSVRLGSGKRLTLGADYTEAATGSNTDGSRNVTITVLAPVPATDKVVVVYASPVVASYPQVSHAVNSATRPAALKGRDIEVFVGGTALSNRWTSVQSVSVDWKVTLERDEEFGNTQIVGQDFEVPEVTGSIDLKPRDYKELYNKVRQIAGVADNEVAGALTTAPLELLIVLHSPVDGSVLKSLYVPDARFSLPGYSGQVQQKLTVTLNWDSDQGQLSVYKGAKA